MNNREKLRKEVYEIVWLIITQHLMQHITINYDPEDDKLEDIGEQIEIGKYNGTFSWRLTRDGQRLTINAFDNGNVSLLIEEQLHRHITININYDDNNDSFLNIVKKTIEDFVHAFIEGNWHILADYLTSVRSVETDWRERFELYKKYEVEHPNVCGKITYI